MASYDPSSNHESRSMGRPVLSHAISISRTDAEEASQPPETSSKIYPIANRAPNAGECVGEHPRRLGASSGIQLRVVASRIPAGFPSPAADYLDDCIDLNAELIIQGHEAATYVLRVKGWSMMEAGIFDGDRIVVDRALSAQQGDIVVAILNGDLTIKRLGAINGRPALLPENPQFQPILMAEGDQLEVWGVVTNCLRCFRRGGR